MEKPADSLPLGESTNLDEVICKTPEVLSKKETIVHSTGEALKEDSCSFKENTNQDWLPDFMTEFTFSKLEPQV